jgi:hypothetical protein
MFAFRKAYMSIKNMYYIDTFGVLEGADVRVITIQREQYDATIHLFIARHGM